MHFALMYSYGNVVHLRRNDLHCRLSAGRQEPRFKNMCLGGVLMVSEVKDCSFVLDFCVNIKHWEFMHVNDV